MAKVDGPEGSTRPTEPPGTLAAEQEAILHDSDPKMHVALVEQAADADLESVRKQAAGWSTTVTAALGVFSISSLVFGKDTFDAAVGKGNEKALGVLAAFAVLAAVVAIGSSAFASYGWPKVPVRVNKRELWGGALLRKRQDAIRSAVLGMRVSMVASAVAAMCLVAAIAVAWIMD
jgi:hypothetical protein